MQLCLGLPLPIIQLREFVLDLDHMDLPNDARAVITARVIIHNTERWPNGVMCDNHWSIYLILKDKPQSVRMNMTKELDDPTWKLIWTDNDYVMSTSRIDIWDYSLKSGVTVATLYNLIMKNQRNQYTMSAGGSGCRWWM